jgi:hypothetical protein
VRSHGYLETDEPTYMLTIVTAALMPWSLAGSWEKPPPRRQGRGIAGRQSTDGNVAASC